MAVLRIDTPQSEPFFTQRVSLEGVSFLLTFKWNSRAAAWFMDLSDGETEDLLRTGLKLVIGFPLLYYTPNLETLPAGEFYVTGLPGQRPGLDNLGTDFVLYYITSDDASLA